MKHAASFAERWACQHLSRDPTPDELAILGIFQQTCEGDEEEAGRRARRYYWARGPGGLSDLWHKRRPDDEDILSSCQDAYIVPLKSRSVAGKRMSIVRMPAPTALDRPLSARALLARWLMILDIRLHEDPTPGEEVVFIDVCDLQPAHLKNHFRGTFWKDFRWLLKNAYPLRFSEVHVINTQRLKTMSLLLLHMGFLPWKRTVVQIHGGDQINEVMGLDFFPVEGLPYEYGGKAGAMKDLNDVIQKDRFDLMILSDILQVLCLLAVSLTMAITLLHEWTKKLLSNSKWLHTEERKYYDTELKPEVTKRKQKKVRNLRRRSEGYDMLTRTHSCKSLHRRDDLEDGLCGAYRTLRVGR